MHNSLARENSPAFSLRFHAVKQLWKAVERGEKLWTDGLICYPYFSYWFCLVGFFCCDILASKEREIVNVKGHLKVWASGQLPFKLGRQGSSWQRKEEKIKWNLPKWKLHGQALSLHFVLQFNQDQKQNAGGALEVRWLDFRSWYTDCSPTLGRISLSEAVL